MKSPPGSPPNLKKWANKMEFLETTVDKFIFKVATDRLYTPEGLWVKNEDSSIRIGVTDFFQQRNGDIAFVNFQPVDMELKPEDEFASVETIKVNLSLVSPFTAKIISVNKEAEAAPEMINQDPYDKGWLCQFSSDHFQEESKKLLSPEQYFVIMKKEAEEEVKKNE
jgi:glycine cleavage system H protein